MPNGDVEITLLEDSGAGSPPATFAGQTVEIVNEPDTIVQGVDGHVSRARHPSKKFWHGGTAKNFARVTHVKIVGRHGDVLADGELTRTFQAPRDVAGGVKFEVLQPG